MTNQKYVQSDPPRDVDGNAIEFVSQQYTAEEPDVLPPLVGYVAVTREDGSIVETIPRDLFDQRYSLVENNQNGSNS